MREIFDLRLRIARVGEMDWMGWWSSNALSDAGRYAIPRLFPRTAEVSAAHVAMAGARARHAAVIPGEPHVHLFDFGEDFEGAFERWLISRKLESESIPTLPKPGPSEMTSASSALAAVGIAADERIGDGGQALALGPARLSAVENASGRTALARRLAAAYAASGPRQLVAPYFRLER